MSELLVTDAAAFPYLFSEELYLIKGEERVVERTLIAAAPQTEDMQQVKAEEQSLSTDAPAIPAAAEELIFDYLGENNRYFLILVDEKQQQYMNAQDLESLLKIMQAKNLELRDLAILNLAKHPGLDLPALKKFFSCTRLTLFGVAPSSIGITELSSNTPTSIDGIKVLATYSFAEMNADMNKKKEFWSVMKPF